MGDFADGQKIIEDLILSTPPIENEEPKLEYESTIELMPISCRQQLSDFDKATTRNLAIQSLDQSNERR